MPKTRQRYAGIAARSVKKVGAKPAARTSFTLDGGPGAPNPPYEHQVTPGIDYEFPINPFILTLYSALAYNIAGGT